ncbi:MAG: glycosyltransferase family 9 protein [Gammaproteobacteria bacterium]|nr:glycosyltransferase family 9 protein [Gammaproteobacteria bacterium]
MPLPLTTPPESICILRLSAIGDVTHLLPTLRSIQHQWPDTKITWIIGRTEYQLVKDIDDVEFILFDKSAGLSAYRTLYQQLRGRRFDVLLHMQISLRASLASLLIRAPIKLGFDAPRSKNLQRFFVNHRIQCDRPRLHVLDTFLCFARTLGIKQDVIEWAIPLSDEDRAFAQQVLANGKAIAINACSSNRARNWRNWDSQSYAAIIDYVKQRYQLDTVLTGGPAIEEKDYARKISDACQHKPLDLVGRTTLKQQAAIFSKVELVIAPDTGPMHVANALGKPVIGLFATSNPYRTGPYSNLHNTVNCYPEALEKEYGLSVDDAKWGKRVRNPEALALITVEQVQQRIDALLQA